MNKKKLLISAAVITILVVPFSVFAASSDTTTAKNIRCFFGMDASKFTAEQKTTVQDYAQKAADLQKEFINKMVSNGALTAEQGKTETARIDERATSGETNGLLPGFGNGQSRGRDGIKGGFGIAGIDVSTLTDTQRSDLIASYKEMLSAQKEFVGTLVSGGLLTEAQGKTATANIDSKISDIDKNGLANCGERLHMQGFEGLGLRGLNLSNITDAQKADLTNFTKKMAELRKALVNKMVADGVLTQAQGTSEIERIDNMTSSDNGINLRKGFGGKGSRR